ncbi:hypothetical protein BB559_006909 [Furculomyces boomerangus]|uniref:Arrestin-like N-terminal domain-containing protein n=1 Tax=Furculomyces boomerangus TaxID=61424 RepID=A0A2T9XZY2_9FUNG|nr:hypothetical protein BB559_006909 [Furculomyces boomerangus]
MLGKFNHSTFEVKVYPFKSEVFIESESSEIPLTLITGIVALRINKPIRINSITVSLNKSKLLQWATGLQTTRIAYNDKYSNKKVSKTNIDTKNILENVLQKGYYEFPFFLWVPDNIEPSLNFKKSFIKYYLEATVNLMPNKSFSLKKVIGSFQQKSDRKLMMIHRIPKNLKQSSWEISEQLPQYINIYQKDNLKIVLMLQTRYLHSTKNSNPVKATLYIDYKPNKDDGRKEISCKEITLTLTEQYKFFEAFYGTSSSKTIILGKKKYSFQDTNTNNITTKDTTKCKLSTTTHERSVSCSQSSTSKLSYQSPSSENTLFFKTPLTDTDPRISYELFLPPFDNEPQPNILSKNYSIDQYLNIKVIIIFKNYEKKRFISSNQSENEIVTKEQTFSTKSHVYGIPKSAQSYIYSLPTYQEINKNHLYHRESTDMEGFIQNEIDILAN